MMGLSFIKNHQELAMNIDFNTLSQLRAIEVRAKPQKHLPDSFLSAFDLLDAKNQGVNRIVSTLQFVVVRLLQHSNNNNKTPLYFDHFHLVSISNRIQCDFKTYFKHSQMLADFLQFLSMMGLSFIKNHQELAMNIDFNTLSQLRAIEVRAKPQKHLPDSFLSAFDLLDAKNQGVNRIVSTLQFVVVRLLQHSNKTPLYFDHFHLVSISNRIQCDFKTYFKHSQMLADFLRFSTNLPFLLQGKGWG